MFDAACFLLAFDGLLLAVAALGYVGERVYRRVQEDRQKDRFSQLSHFWQQWCGPAAYLRNNRSKPSEPVYTGMGVIGPAEIGRSDTGGIPVQEMEDDPTVPLPVRPELSL